MHGFSTTRRVPHPPEKMFDLVADVERYPEFVPFCERLTVRKRKSENGREVIVADMTIGYKLIRETFTSRVVFDRGALKIEGHDLAGPFRRMENHWTFHALPGGGSEVRFQIAYEFRSRTLAMLMGAVFDRAFRMFVHAFETRADRVYERKAEI
ncbi:MAG: type II toxin-antitoxin system RatA family toxin [Propylenella sp.]